jgi:membrane protein DedA with SNARE-associated domain
MLDHLDSYLDHYGYGLVGLIVGLESMGLPLPGESMIVGAALYCATTGRLHISGVVATAALGAIMGDNLGFLIGHTLGTRLLARFGGRLGLTPARLRLGLYLFRHHAWKLIFFGRFIAVLRTFAALLAGATGMHWRTFLVFNALGGLAWTSLYGFGAYSLGNAAKRVAGPFGIALGVIAVLLLVAALIFIKHHEDELTRKAEQDMQREAAR